MKNNKIVIGVILSILVILTSVGIYELTDMLSKNDSRNTELFKGNFVEACIIEGGTYTQCTCYYNEILNEFGISDLIQSDLNMQRGGEFPTKYYGAILSCI